MSLKVFSLSAIFWIVLCLHGKLSKGGRYHKRYLHCPEQTIYYATIDGFPHYYEINGVHSNNPSDTNYIWEIIETMGCDEQQILTDGWDEDTFKILKPEEYCEMKIGLELEAVFDSKTRSTGCYLTVIFELPPYFGIDLGTTFSCIAYQSKETDHKTNTRKTEIIVVDRSTRRQFCIPTAIYFPPNTHNILFGHDAMDQLNVDPHNVIYDIKRIIGRKYGDLEVKLFENKHMFTLMEDMDGKIAILIPNRNDSMISPEQMLASIIIHLVDVATKQIGTVYSDDINVVISVPAFFHNAQRRAIKSVAEIARLNLQILVVEPTAAALAHAYYAAVPTDDMKLFMVFDFGGGTLDCSVMRCYGLQCDVLGVEGNSTLGGIDFDHVVEDIIVDKLINDHGIDAENIDHSALLKDAERLKKGLSLNDQHEFKYNDELPEIIITQKEFESHPKTVALLDAAMDVARRALDGNNTKFLSSNVRMILMVGGTSNIPIVSKTLQTAFEKEFVSKETKRHRLRIEFPEIDPQLMVITGSAVLSGALAYDNDHINAAAEVLADDSFSATAPTNINGIQINDVIPLSLGFEVCKRGTNDGTLECGFMSVMVSKNSRYPIRVNKTYCQHNVNQTTVTMMLYEGNSEYVSENHYLSSLLITGLLPRKIDKECNTYHMVFNIDRNGIATIHGVVHNEEGNDAHIYTMSLAVLSNDGSLSKCQILKQQRQMVQWFETVEVKRLLWRERERENNEKISCLLKQYTQRNHVYLDASGSMRTAFFSSYSWFDIGKVILKQIAQRLHSEPTRLTLFDHRKKQILDWSDIGDWHINQVMNEWQRFGGGGTFMWKMILDDIIQHHDDNNLRARITIITDGEDNGSPEPYNGLNGMNPMMKQFNKLNVSVEFNIIVLSDAQWDAMRYRDLCIATGGLFQKITDNSLQQMDFFKNEFLEPYLENNDVIVQERRNQQKKIYENNVNNHVIEPFDWY